MRECCGGAEEAVEAGMAPTASLNATWQGQKAQVLEISGMGKEVRG